MEKRLGDLFVEEETAGVNGFSDSSFVIDAVGTVDPGCGDNCCCGRGGVMRVPEQVVGLVIMLLGPDLEMRQGRPPSVPLRSSYRRSVQ